MFHVPKLTSHLDGLPNRVICLGNERESEGSQLSTYLYVSVPHTSIRRIQFTGEMRLWVAMMHLREVTVLKRRTSLVGAFMVPQYLLYSICGVPIF